MQAQDVKQVEGLAFVNKTSRRRKGKRTRKMFLGETT